jgi:hypothetical protein
MIEALCDHLPEKPGLYLDEMAVFLRDEFQTLVTISSIKRAIITTVNDALFAAIVALSPI